VLVELTLVLGLLCAVYAGTVAVHRSADRRFRRIVQTRNDKIEKARRTPQLLLGR
jgi:hypothetical protein